MKLRQLRPLTLLPGLLILTGCSSLSPTENGILGGGGIGAATGALIGSATGHTGAGAAIGAGVGAVSGGLVGNQIEQSENRTKAAVAAAQAPARGPLGLAEVAQMAQQGISDSVIISQIRTTRSVYNLTPNDIAWLKSQNVSDGVVMEMQATASRVVPADARVYGRAYYSPDVVYVQPAPPPPIGVGFSYTAVRRW
jgi:hypothetical protein